MWKSIPAMAAFVAALAFAAPAGALESGLTCDDGEEEYLRSVENGDTGMPTPVPGS